MSSHPETFSAFDPADYLNSFDDVVAYLEAVIDEVYRNGVGSRQNMTEAIDIKTDEMNDLRKEARLCAEESH